MAFDDGEKMDLEEEFEIENDARDAAYQAASDYSQGGDYLAEAGEDDCDAEVIGFILESDTETIEIDVS